MKKILALLLLTLLALSFGACATTPTVDTSLGGSTAQVSGTSSRDTDTQDKPQDSTQSSTQTEKPVSTQKWEWNPDSNFPNQVLACDHQQSRLVLYDMSLLGDSKNLDQAEIWEYPTGFVAGQKYRENTVYGDVVIFCGPEGPFAVTYPGKELVWRGHAGSAGSNPHSIEILPSGNIVTASSSDSSIRIFNTKNAVEKKDTTEYRSYGLTDAHGVLWDPANNCLWALGKTQLVAYEVVDQGDGTERLRKINGKGGKLPTEWGHDLSADFTDSGYLFVTTNTAVYRFEKATGKFFVHFKQASLLNRDFVKGFGNNLNGNYFSTRPNGGKDREWEGTSIAEWCTDTIMYYSWTGKNNLEATPCVSATSAFYKVRVFCGAYQ